MAGTLNWREPRDELGGLTPEQWLRERYPHIPHNKDIAAELQERLGIERSLLKPIYSKAGSMGMTKTKEAMEVLNKARGDILRSERKPAVHIFDDWPTRQWDPFLVTSDWHVPFYNQDYANRIMAVARNWKPEPIRNLLIGGDFMDFGQLSIFLPEEEEEPHKLEDDLDEAEMLLDWMTGWFEDVLVLKANHERRLAKALGNQVSQHRLGRLMHAGLDRLKWSNWTYCVITDGNGAEWRITHPGRRWKLLGRLSQELANRHQMNTILAHSHVMSLTYNISGDFICADSGGMFDERALGYYMKEDSAYWAWCRGFLVVSNGKVHAFNDKWTDWGMYSDWLGVEL